MTHDEWVEQRLARAIERVRAAVEPGRHDAVLGAAASVADYVAAGALARGRVEAELLRAAADVGLGGKRAKEAARCVAFGLDKGDASSAWWPGTNAAPVVRRYRWAGGRILEVHMQAETDVGGDFLPVAPLLRGEVRLTFFRDRFATQGEVEVWTWDTLAEMVAEPLAWPGNKAALPLWSPAEYEDDSRAERPDGLDDSGQERTRQARIEAVHALVLDYDDDPEFGMDAVAQWWGAVRYVAHTSASHAVDKGKREALPRGRVVLALTRAVTEEEFGALAGWVLACGRGQPGKAELRNARRAYFVPAYGPGGYEHAVHMVDTALDVDAVLERWARMRAQDAAAAIGREPQRDVLAELVVRKDGSPTSSLHNLLTVLDTDTRWLGRLVRCEFSRRSLLDGQPITDEVEVEVGGWLGRVYAMDPGVERIHQALSAVCARHRAHPIRAYLDGLRWDGEARLAAWLRYVGCDDTDDGLTSLYGERWLISAVARVYEPGCQADSVLILAGPQGYGKTSAFRTLAGIENHSETRLPIGEKDAYQQLDGVWIYELAELDSLRRSEVSAVKAFITTRIDRFRASYARNTESRPRQCVFGGSTNDAQFLPDAGRRWWVRQLRRKADLAWLSASRDQLWAEAVHCYRAGLPWWLEGDAAEAQAADTEGYRHTDPWEQVVEDYLLYAKDTTIRELLEKAVKRPIEQFTRTDEMRLAEILKGLGWSKGKDYRGRSLWVRP